MPSPELGDPNQREAGRLQSLVVLMQNYKRSHPLGGERCYRESSQPLSMGKMGRVNGRDTRDR